MCLHRTNLEWQVLRERWVQFFPVVRFKPGIAAWNARKLPLCYAVPLCTWKVILPVLTKLPFFVQTCLKLFPAFVAAKMIGARLGRWDIPGDPPMGCPSNAVIGLCMLWWSWLAFNAGSTFGRTVAFLADVPGDQVVLSQLFNSVSKKKKKNKKLQSLPGSFFLLFWADHWFLEWFGQNPNLWMKFFESRRMLLRWLYLNSNYKF